MVSYNLDKIKIVLKLISLNSLSKIIIVVVNSSENGERVSILIFKWPKNNKYLASNCKVEFYLLSCSLYPVPNLLVF